MAQTLATSPASAISSLLVMTYNTAGDGSVRVEGWPLLGWQYDEANPINPKPITIGNPLVAPPNTGAVKSPQWAYIVTDDAVFVPDGWRGTIAEFFTWLATNNGASRRVTANLTFPALLNIWNIWAHANPQWSEVWCSSCLRSSSPALAVLDGARANDCR
jgi:hypothetical protein